MTQYPIIGSGFAAVDIRGPSMKNEQIKAIFLANGFNVKDQGAGLMDLNPYVYDAAWALISAFAPPADVIIPIDDHLLHGMAKTYSAALKSEAEGDQGMVNAMRKSLNEMLALSPPNVWAAIARVAGHDEHTFEQWYETRGKDLLNYEMGCEHLMEAAWDSALSRNPSPRRPTLSSGDTPQLESDLYAVIHLLLSNHRLTLQLDDSNSGYPLIEALTSDGTDDISSGLREIEYLADTLFNEVIDFAEQLAPSRVVEPPDVPDVPHQVQFKSAFIEDMVIKHGLTSDAVKSLADLLLKEVELATEPSIVALKNAERDLEAIRKTCDRASACLTRWQNGYSFQADGVEAQIQGELYDAVSPNAREGIKKLHALLESADEQRIVADN
jgi:hypothetical protein